MMGEGKSRSKISKRKRRVGKERIGREGRMEMIENKFLAGVRRKGIEDEMVEGEQEGWV